MSSHGAPHRAHGSVPAPCPEAALYADDAGRPDDADRYRRRALLARQASVPASLAAIGGGR